MVCCTVKITGPEKYEKGGPARGHALWSEEPGMPVFMNGLGLLPHGLAVLRCLLDLWASRTPLRPSLAEGSNNKGWKNEDVCSLKQQAPLHLPGQMTPPTHTHNVFFNKPTNPPSQK